MWTLGATNQLCDGVANHPLSMGLHAHVYEGYSPLLGNPSPLQLDTSSNKFLCIFHQVLSKSHHSNHSTEKRKINTITHACIQVARKNETNAHLPISTHISTLMLSQ